MEAAKSKIQWTETELLNALAIRYSPPEWAFLPHVRRGTGFSTNIRTADGIAMNLFPSRGMELMGFEVKCSRSDWLNELKKPHKAEEIAQFCDRWWLVIADENFVKPGELPSTWGLITPHGNGLKCRKEAEKMQSKAIDKPFLGAIFRRVQESIVSDDLMLARYVAGKKEGQRIAEENSRLELARAKNDLANREKEIEIFEIASGFKIREFSWGDPKKLKLAFEIAKQGSETLEYTKRQLSSLRDAIDKILEK
jgi:hypothetical protein